MKKFIFFPVLLILILTGSIFSQPVPGEYKKIDYIRVGPEQLASFVDQANDELRAVYQQLVDGEELNDWRLYYVRYPGGETSSYNFVSIVSATDLDAFESIFSSVSVAPYVPSASISSIEANHEAIVKTELWKVQNALLDSTNDYPSSYMTMDYMDVAPNKNPDYLMLEDEVAKPIHSERMDKDIMAGWEVYSLLTPGGVGYGYNFATANFYDALEHIEYGFTNEIINQAIGANANIPELFETIYATRDQVKVELWKLVTHTE
ncbi:hypothetical protein [Fodinibius sediminis]|uniref:Uncharacterized protein n=1 Tax=Fodinibius sediminis TaxID=1214077 RepID=A0A521BJG8_9BACT|nr:hypothetical protein [Fodinibius sediminis]SMO47206.1 hypothetical protein SAMN06265218_103163 [Fodinibius sediminis]